MTNVWGSLACTPFSAMTSCDPGWNSVSMRMRRSLRTFAERVIRVAPEQLLHAPFFLEAVRKVGVGLRERARGRLEAAVAALVIAADSDVSDLGRAEHV